MLSKEKRRFNFYFSAENRKMEGFFFFLNLLINAGLEQYLVHIKHSINCFHCLVPQSCPTLCDPIDCSLPGSSVHGIFQVRILEWVAISFSRGSSQPRDQILASCIGRQILYH